MNSASHKIDLRSDTVTRPTDAMRDAIARAEVGDDVYGDDPTVNALQARTAAMFGKEAALFVPSGTMANQIALRTHTEPGDEIIVESSAHIFLYEGGAFAALSGLSVRCVPGQHGLLSADAVRAAIRAEDETCHLPTTKVVCLENSANRGGGTVYTAERTEAIAEVAQAHDLRLHLDGARVFNAAVALGISPATLAAPYDSISCCFSKGLGCPVGSVLIGSNAFIKRARRFRKMFGGGMRQAGMLAAAGLHALDHHVERLAEDHSHARHIAESLNALPGAQVDLNTVVTNMAYIDVSPSGMSAPEVVAALARRGVLVNAVSASHLRVVTHLDVDRQGVEAAIVAFREVLAEAR